MPEIHVSIPELEPTMQSDFTPRTTYQRSTRAIAFGDQVSAQPRAWRRISSLAELCEVSCRAGYSTTQAQALVRDMPDPIDFERDGEALFKRGISLDRLMDARGGSP